MDEERAAARIVVDRKGVGAWGDFDPRELDLAGKRSPASLVRLLRHHAVHLGDQAGHGLEALVLRLLRGPLGGLRGRVLGEGPGDGLGRDARDAVVEVLSRDGGHVLDARGPP